MSVMDIAIKHSDGQTFIFSNGSYRNPRPPKVEIAELLKVIEDNVLDPVFEEFGGYELSPFKPIGQGEKYTPLIGTYSILGNFITVSHVFSIATKDPKVIAKLQAAINENMAKPEYHIAAYTLYKDWFYVKTASGDSFVVSPSVARDIQNGNVTDINYPRNFEELSVAEVIGPRFPEKPECVIAVENSKAGTNPFYHHK